MRSEIKTFAILGCAGAAVAAGAIVTNRWAADGTGAMGATTAMAATTRPAGPPSCGAEAAARASADFGRGTLSAALSAGKIVRGGGGEVYAAFALATGQAVATERPPLHLALVIDRSGSMDGDKIAGAKQAAAGLVARLGERDRVSLIQYESQAEIVLSSIATDAAGKARLRGAIGEIVLGGGTNLHAGMMLGRDALRSTAGSGWMSRVILLSDGQANAGVIDPSRIADAARRAADEGVRITAVGLGVDYNEDLMEAIAESGRGNYYYVKDAPGLAAVLAGELTGLEATVATGVELHLSSKCPGVEVAEVMGYESRRQGDTVIVPMADLAGSDGRKLLIRLHVPDGQLGTLGAITAELRFRDAKTGEALSARVALGVEVTSDETAALASVDQGVISQVMTAQASHTMRQAAAAYDRGDVEGATRLIDASSTKLEADRGRYKVSAQAIAPAMDSLREMKTATGSARPGSEAGKHIMKASKAKARGMDKGKF